MYFDQLTVAMHTIYWSKSFFQQFNIFSVTNRKNKIYKKQKTNTNRALPVFRSYSQTLVDNQRLVDSWGKYDFYWEQVIITRQNLWYEARPLSTKMKGSTRQANCPAHVNPTFHYIFWVYGSSIFMLWIVRDGTIQ